MVLVPMKCVQTGSTDRFKLDQGDIEVACPDVLCSVLLTFWVSNYGGCPCLPAGQIAVLRGREVCWFVLSQSWLKDRAWPVCSFLVKPLSRNFIVFGFCLFKKKIHT